MHAIILAGGFGTRLQARCSKVPKPLAPVAEKPFLTYLLAFLASQGITSVTLSLHYLADTIKQYFKDCYLGIKLHYCYEPVALGTGGAVRLALKDYKEQQPVYVLNGDSLIQIDLLKMQAVHQASGAKLTMALRPMADCRRYGKVHVVEDYITAFQEKGDSGAGFINAGVYCMEPDLLNQAVLPEVFSLETDFLQPMVKQIKPRAFICEGYFIDIGIPEDYDRAQNELPKYFKTN